MFQLFSLHRLLEARVGCVASSVLRCTYPHNIITRRKRFCVHNHECIIVHSLIGDLAHSFPVWCEIWLDNLIDIGFLISRRSSNQIKVTEFSNSLTRTPPPPLGVLNWPNFSNRFHFSSSMILRKSSRNMIFFIVRLCPWQLWQFGDWNCFLIENALEYLPMSWAYKLEREWSL